MFDVKIIAIFMALGMIVYDKITINELTTEVGALRLELLATQTNLENVTAGYVSEKKVSEVKTKTVDSVNQMLSKCYADLETSQQAYAEIEEIMRSTTGEEISKSSIPVVTKVQERKGLTFVNKQLSRLQDLSR